MVGIVSYGTYIPKYRIKTEDIAKTWSKDPSEIVASLGISEKSVAGIDEDTVTIAYEASSRCLSCFDGKATDVETIFVGSESHPYAVNPTSTTVGELLGVGRNYLAADMEFACKAATAGMQAIAGLVASSHIKYGLAVAADTAQGKPHDVLEYTAGSGGAAFLIGSNNVIAGLLEYLSYSSDTPDFWRRDGIRYPTHAGRFTGEPAYFAHVMATTQLIMKKSDITPKDVTYCVFHMPNGKFPQDVAKRLGFAPEQLAPSYIVDKIGNPYTAASLLGFSAVLDIAKPGDTILLVSYGSGAGCDAFYFKVTNEMQKYQKNRSKINLKVQNQIENKTYISYEKYLRMTGKL